MGKRVSADTITEITTSKDFLDHHITVPKQPSVEDLIADIRKDLSERVVLAKRREAQGLHQGDHPRDRFQTAADAVKDQKMFEQILKEIPEGFRIVPVFYNRITTDENAKLKNEYTFEVRPSFIRFLADNFEKELLDLGICQAGVDRMKNGLDPANENGELYSLNVDHIIERAGSGRYGKTKDVDPDQPGFGPKYHPNFFGNFMLLPEKIHEFKNELNDLQKASYTSPGMGRWILMMTPERNAQYNGYLCPKLKASHRLAGIEVREIDDFRRVEHGQYVLGQTLNKIDVLRSIETVFDTVVDLVEKADSLKGTVVELAHKEDASAPGSLRKAFTDAVVRADAGDHFDKMVRPAVKDMTDYTVTLFDRLANNLNSPKERAAMWEFAHFFRSPRMNDLRFDVQALPFEEAFEMNAKFNAIEKSLKQVCDRLDLEGKAIREQRDVRKGFNNNSNDNRNVQQDNRPARGPVVRDEYGKKIRQR